MKLVPLVETSNVHAAVPEGLRCHCGCGEIQAYPDVRPSETEADLIAAAAPFGLVTRRRLFDLLTDDVSCDGSCLLCNIQQKYTTEEAMHSACLGREDTLTNNGWTPETIPPYDPTLRL